MTRTPPEGISAARALTARIDATILGCVGGAVDATAPVALCAVGSYGRGELTPGSDVDVLLLHGLRSREEVEAATRAVLYPLWDLGLELGYAVRTVKECLQGAREDPVIATTLFDTRLVAGDPRLPEMLSEQLSRWRRKRGGSLQRALLEDVAERHARYGDAGSALEPHVKEGRGGLRDLQTLRWLGVGDDLETELGLLLALRAVLHELAGKRQDVLTRELLAPAAALLGYTDGDPREELMRDVFVACRNVGSRLDLHTRATLASPRRVACPDGFALVDGRLERTSRAVPGADPVSAFAAARVAGAVAPGPATLAWARSGEGPIPWTAAARDEFVRFLTDAPRAGWELLDVTGLWTRYLPELAGIRARTQHNPLHVLAVDAHCWRTLEEARALASDPNPLVRETWCELDQHETLLLAALLHDAGKGVPGDHSREGVILARKACERAGFGADVEETLAFLVANHLLLADFATGRDLNDEELVLGLAARLGHPQRLRLLYLLTIADSRATGPAAWSTWKAALLDELYDKLRGFVDAGSLVGRDIENRLSRKLTETLAFCAGDDAEARQRAASRLDGFGRRYLLAQPVETIAVHLDLLDRLATAARDTAVIAAREETLSVLCRDRPGLLATVAAVLAGNGVGVRTADVYTTSDGLAVDVLRVVDAHDETVAASKWERVAADLDAALAGALDPDALVAERAGRYDREVTDDVTVQVDNDASDWYSVVEVRSPDRVGLLSDIAAVLNDEGLHVHYSKVATEAGVARDSFSVRGADGAKISDPEGLSLTVRSRMRDRVAARRAGHGTDRARAD